MKSPIFVAFDGSPWRSRLVETWKYLRDNYEITGNEKCGTHIHVSVEGGYSFEEIKHIAASALYFEPAFDALVPLDRTGGQCEYARNLWLDGRNLAKGNRSRVDSCKYIKTIPDFKYFLDVMNPSQHMYSWNFRCIARFYTIEFRKPPFCTAEDEVLAWAEIVMAFIQSSIRYGGTMDILETIPPTVKGLRCFLEKSHIPGMSKHEQFEWVFRGKDPDAFVEATTWKDSWNSNEMQLQLERMKRTDRRRIQRLRVTAREPYL